MKFKYLLAADFNSTYALFQIIAVAIETAIQNGGIAVVVLNLTFPR